MQRPDVAGGSGGSGSSQLQHGRPRKTVSMYDCRCEHGEPSKKDLDVLGLDYNGFLQTLAKLYSFSSYESYVVVTTDRKVMDFDKFEKLPGNSILYLLKNEHQALPSAIKEVIKYEPHFDTMLKAGMSEYYSQTKKSLPYALAELVDNCLSATSLNSGMRTIEIRMLFDKTVGKPAVLVIDNGCGMTSKQLNNWAVFRLSKFERKNSMFASDKEGYVRPQYVYRSLNSDISYFGVGGKQAAFFIGDSVKMISKPANSPDVHEVTLSEEDFRNKELNNKEIYEGTILNRKACDSSHIREEERFLHSVIAEERGKKSFTVVVIMGVRPEHMAYLTKEFDQWTRELAHIYHYYIHGVNGNDMRSGQSTDQPKMDILVTLREKPPKCPCAINLREVENDMQTLYINAAVDTFEFKASTGPDGGIVDGILRYHPFLYDKETYPKDPFAPHAPVDDDDDDYENISGNLNQARGNRDIFECFWNGRLIPDSTVSGFDWCSRPSKGATLSAECYGRFSGALFTNDVFTVTTSKLKYMNIDERLKAKDTIFTPLVNAQKHSKRGNIQKEFTLWLQNCHEKYDKQVKFADFRESITRTDVQIKRMQHPWATFSTIKWDGKTYKAGQLMKSHKTQPILYGTVVRFLLYGDYDGDVFATGGQVEVTREPKELYNTTKIIPISKIDKAATDESIKKYIENDTDKLPKELKVDWSIGNSWPQNGEFTAGSPIGPFKVEILNRKGDSLSSIHTGGQGMGMRMIVGLKVIHHTPKGDKEVVMLNAPYIAKHGYWFKKIENLTILGKYSLALNAIISESNATVFVGHPLPSHMLKFSIKEGEPETFTVGDVNPTVRIGVPFNIPLKIKDGYDHPVTPPSKTKPVLECSGLDLNYETVSSCSSSKSFIIRGVKAIGKIENCQQSKSYNLTVTLPGLKNDKQTIKISLLPGSPHCLHVKQEMRPFKVENGEQASFTAQVLDEAGNITANPKQIVRYQISGFTAVTADCSSTGCGQLVTKPVTVNIIDGEPQMLDVKFDMPNQKHIAPITVELKVLPSSRVSKMEVYCQGGDNLVLKNNEKIQWQVGGLLENLFYKLYDESGSEVPLTAEIASKIKVNWTGNVDQTNLARGRLPDVQVPTQVQELRFYQVSYQDQKVSFSFTVIPCPDEPKQLRATLTHTTVKLGETLAGHINLELVDQYDNITQRLTPACMDHINVEAEDLIKSEIAFIWEESSSSFAVTGVRFQSGSPGPRELCFTYRDFVDRVVVKVTAGVPAKLKLLSGPEQPLQVLNCHGISTPFVVQLCDEWGNPSPDQRVVVQIKCSSPVLKVKSTVTSQPVDAEGKASFTVNCIDGKKGCHQVEFKGFFNRKPIPGPSVNLTVIPDPNKPVGLSVNYDTNAKFLAGGTFPVFTVTVVSDEGSPITSCNPANLSMLLWEGDSSTPPHGTLNLKCSKPMEHDKKDCFYFRDKTIPEKIGKYTIQFSLSVNKVLFSNEIKINVVANMPFKLGPDSQPNTPVVSYSMDVANRKLVENLTLNIKDEFGNPAGQDLKGKVVVSIRCPDAERSRTLPLLEGKNESIQIALQDGKAQINDLAIMENSPGENGSTYILVFKPEVLMISATLAAFELPFHFYNDAENQRKMSELTRKKDELTVSVAQYNQINASYSQIRELLTSQLLDATKKEYSLKNELNKLRVELVQNVSISGIDNLLSKKTADAERIERMPRRTCTIKNNFRRPDVLGMVGHLALVEDDDVARVLSWHLRGDMDCVITETTAAAQKIYHETNGRQQVMPLDGIHLHPGNRQLPHERNSFRLFEPLGNPVYARDLLIYLHDRQKCETVFKNLLGDTIVMDDLDSATNYRRALVETKIQCPTILTRQGDRVSARGKFGGLQNKAPPIHQLQVFGAPLPQHYYSLKEQIDLLRQYHSAVMKKEKAEKDRDEHIRTWQSPQMLQKQQNMENIKKELADINRQLASGRRGKRGPEDDEQSGMMKRPR